MRQLFTSTVVLLLMLSCNKKKENNYSQRLEESSTVLAKQSFADCNCASSVPTGCPQSFYDCANHFLNNQSTQNITINWSYCNAVPLPSGSNCNNLQPTNTSNLKLCWLNCSQVKAIITNKPPCLPCIPDPYCVDLTPTCSNNGNSNSYVLSGTDGSTQSELKIEMIIFDDPNITLKCKNGTGSNAVEYTCVGYY